MASQLGERIHLARKKCGFSLRGLSEAMGGAVSYETIRQLENGVKNPDSPTLIALCEALGVSLAYLMSPQQITLGDVDFRKKSKTSVADRAAIRAELLELLERYLQIEDILELDENWSVPDLGVPPTQDDTYAEGMALALREHWSLGQAPIGDLAELLEEKGIKVLIPEVALDISGLTCEVHRPQRPSVCAIVINREHGLERRRFTLAHELAHRVLDCQGMTVKAAESLCNRFAGAFLVPENALKREMGANQRPVIFQEILIVKKFFRVSAAMMVMRLEQVGIMERFQRDWFFRTVGREWRTVEPESLEDSSSKLELPSRFQLLVYRALASGFISINKAAELLRTSPDEIEHGLRG